MEEKNLLRALQLVTDLTTSGKDCLDPTKFKQLKRICKVSDEILKEVYAKIIKMLKKKHAEIRFSAFQMCEEFFTRSHLFKKLFIGDIKMICELILGTNKYMPMPDPQSVSRKLKERAVFCIKKWKEEYGSSFTELSLAYNYLRDYHKIDFEEVTARTEAERFRDEAEAIRRENIKQQKINKIKEELQNYSLEIETTVTEFQNAFNILVPKLNDFYIPLPDKPDSLNNGPINDLCKTNSPENLDDIEYGSEYMRKHGIIKGTTVQVQINNLGKIYESNENEIVISTMKEKIDLMKNTYINKVKQWQQILIPYSDCSKDLIKNILDLKSAIQGAMSTYASLTIIPKDGPSLSNKKECDLSSDDDDDDFIEISPDDPKVIQALASEAELLGYSSCTRQTNDLSPGAGPSGISSRLTAHPKKLCPESYLSEGDWHPPTRYENTLAGLSQVWNANEALHEHEFKNSGILGIDTRPVNFEREFEPIKWECRAPMKSGRLCPRKDREKCPFHGPIIPRNEIGIPINKKDKEEERARLEKYERENPDHQNPQLLQEIKLATGVDLDMKKAKKRKNKYPNLTNIKVKRNTPKFRLRKKIFNKKALGRVAKILAKSEK